MTALQALLAASGGPRRHSTRSLIVRTVRHPSSIIAAGILVAGASVAGATDVMGATDAPDPQPVVRAAQPPVVQPAKYVARPVVAAGRAPSCTVEIAARPNVRHALRDPADQRQAVAASEPLTDAQVSTLPAREAGRRLPPRPPVAVGQEASSPDSDPLSLPPVENPFFDEAPSRGEGATSNGDAAADTRRPLSAMNLERVFTPRLAIAAADTDAVRGSEASATSADELPWRDPHRGAVDEIRFPWTARNLAHRTLYFEDMPLERYGWTKGELWQPFLSTADSLATSSPHPCDGGRKCRVSGIISLAWSGRERVLPACGSDGRRCGIRAARCPSGA